MEPCSFPASLTICDTRLLNLALDDAVTAIELALAARHPTRIAFVNADCINIAAKNDAYQKSLTDMDWVFIDGVGMRIAGKVLKQRVRDNVNGTDLFPRLCASLATSGHRLYLLGARPGVAAAAAEWARTQYPGLVVAGTHDGYFTAEEESDVVANIRACGADIVLVGLGAPRQEAWIEHHISASGAIVAIGVGGLFDYYSGRIPRAPLWMRRISLEWVFRLLQEPTRLWRRYLLGNAIFLCRIGTEWLKTNYRLHLHTGK